MVESSNLSNLKRTNLHSTLTPDKAILEHTASTSGFINVPPNMGNIYKRIDGVVTNMGPITDDMVEGSSAHYFNQIGELNKQQYLEKYNLGPMDNKNDVFGNLDPQQAAAESDTKNPGIDMTNFTETDNLDLSGNAVEPGSELETQTDYQEESNDYVAPDLKDMNFRGNLEQDSFGEGVDPKLYAVNESNQYFNPDTGAVRDLGFAPEVGRAPDPHKMPTGTTGFQMHGFETYKSGPNTGKEIYNQNSMFPTELPKVTQEKKYFKEVKGGPMYVNTSNPNGLNATGMQEQFSKQQANRAYNTIISDWQTKFLRAGMGDDKKQTAGSNKAAQAHEFVKNKISIIDSWSGKNSDLGGYKDMFKEDLSQRYTNLYGAPTSSFNTGSQPAPFAPWSNKKYIKPETKPTPHNTPNPYAASNFANPDVQPFSYDQPNNKKKNTYTTMDWYNMINP